MRRPAFLWFVAVVLTLASAAYQRLSGPTVPLRGSVVVSGDRVSYKLPRSHGGDGDARLGVIVPNAAITGTIEYRRYRSNDPWSSEPMSRSGDTLMAMLPHQPAAGKVAYRVALARDGQAPVSLTKSDMILRFKGAVPLAVLIPHIVLMFGAMLLSARAGLEGIRKRPRALTYAAWTAVLMLVGGLIFGPIVQKYAFGSFWTGWPFGHDLTDNKTFVAFLVWLIAFFRLRRKPGSRWLPIIAAIVTLAVFLIPHSVLGSELDHSVLSDQETLR
jgi:hypothetical protein